MKRKNDKIRDFGRYRPTRFDRSFSSLWENLHDFNGSSLHPFNAASGIIVDKFSILFRTDSLPVGYITMSRASFDGSRNIQVKLDLRRVPRKGFCSGEIGHVDGADGHVVAKMVEKETRQLGAFTRVRRRNYQIFRIGNTKDAQPSSALSRLR